MCIIDKKKNKDAEMDRHYDAMSYLDTVDFCDEICSQARGGTAYGYTGKSALMMVEMAYGYTENGRLLNTDNNRFGVTQLTSEAVYIAKNTLIPRVPQFREILGKKYNVDFFSLKPEDLNDNSKLCYIVTRLYLESLTDIPRGSENRADFIASNMLKLNDRKEYLGLRESFFEIEVQVYMRHLKQMDLDIDNV